LIDPSGVLPITESEFQEILFAMEMFDGGGEQRLKPVFEALDKTMNLIFYNVSIK